MNEIRRYRVADVWRSYTPEKARAEWHGEWAAALIYRPISIWLTPLFLNLGVSANAVTSGSLLLAAAIPFVVLWSGPWAAIWVGLFAFGWVVLDCVDGNIARVMNSSSARGWYFDFLADIVFRIVLYCAIGYLADNMAGENAVVPGAGFALAAIAVILYLAARMCRYARMRKFPDAGKPDGGPKSGTTKVTGYLFPIISGIDRLLPFGLIAAPFVDGLLWALVVWLVVYGLIDFLYTQAVAFRVLPR